MPAATQYTPDDRELRAAADSERRTRQDRHDRNWRYYTGQHHRPLKVTDGIDDNVVLNLCKQTIDRTVSFLVPTFPRLQLDPDAQSPREDWLNATWSGSGGAALLLNMALNGALDGHVFARVVMGQGGPQVINLSGRDTIAFWNADNYDEVLWYELRWQAGRTHWRQDVVNDGARWLVRDYRMVGARYELADETIWPYALGPIVSWRHLPQPNSFYGMDELPHAALNDTVNRIASDMARILRFHAFPRTIGTGFEAAAVQPTAVDNFWSIPETDAKVFNLEMQGDLTASLNFLQYLTDTFLAESRVTMVHGDPNAVKGVTNLAIRALYLDMIAKNEVLRRHYGHALAALSRRLLLLGGYGDVTPTVEWPDALPTDKREQLETIRAQLDLGLITQKQAQAQLGIDH